jgi:hypothetical protein
LDYLIKILLAIILWTRQFSAKQQNTFLRLDARKSVVELTYHSANAVSQSAYVISKKFDLF